MTFYLIYASKRLHLMVFNIMLAVALNILAFRILVSESIFADAKKCTNNEQKKNIEETISQVK